jgi:hypothetical protein
MLMPPMVGGVFYEHGHRMAASAVGFLTLVLAVWTSRREPRRGVRRLAWAALAAVVVQGLLGGATVIFLLPTPISITHACLAQTFFCLVIALAYSTSPEWLDASPVADRVGLRGAADQDRRRLRAALIGASCPHRAGLPYPTSAGLGRLWPPFSDASGRPLRPPPGRGAARSSTDRPRLAVGRPFGRPATSAG